MLQSSYLAMAFWISHLLSENICWWDCCDAISKDKKMILLHWYQLLSLLKPMCGETHVSWFALLILIDVIDNVETFQYFVKQSLVGTWHIIQIIASRISNQLQSLAQQPRFIIQSAFRDYLLLISVLIINKSTRFSISSASIQTVFIAGNK